MIIFGYSAHTNSYFIHDIDEYFKPCLPTILSPFVNSYNNTYISRQMSRQFS